MFEASLTDDARVIIYDPHMFIVQVTDGYLVLEQSLALMRVFKTPLGLCCNVIQYSGFLT
jgi:hypothetical protein